MQLLQKKNIDNLSIPKLWLLVVLSIWTLGLGIFIASFINKILLDIIQECNICGDKDSSKSRSIMGFLFIFFLTSFIITLYYWILRNNY